MLSLRDLDVKALFLIVTTLEPGRENEAFGSDWSELLALAVCGLNIPSSARVVGNNLNDFIAIQSRRKGQTDYRLRGVRVVFFWLAILSKSSRCELSRRRSPKSNQAFYFRKGDA